MCPWPNQVGATTCADTTRARFGAFALLAVGNRPLGDGRWGHSDLAGNVLERTLDGSGSGPPDPGWAYPAICDDCAVFDHTGTYRSGVSRGGSIAWPNAWLFTSYRVAGISNTSMRHAAVGARCARPR